MIKRYVSLLTCGVLCISGPSFAQDESKPVATSKNGHANVAIREPARSSATADSSWLLSGNSGTIAGVHFLGTTDFQPLELWVNGQRALRLEPSLSESDAPSLLGGSLYNFVAFESLGATISGGGTKDSPNTILGCDYCTILGGIGNVIAPGGNEGGVNLSTDTSFVAAAATPRIVAAIAAGDNNAATASWAIAAGGKNNTASAIFATVSGGNLNTASGPGSSVSGGIGNTANGRMAAIGGGHQNQAAGEFSVVPGGEQNRAAADYSFAAGRRAKANHAGTFVWADSNDFDFPSTANNEFSVRATGGVRFVTAIAGGGGGGAPTAGVRVPAGGNAWEAISDRHLKKNFRPVEGNEILGRLAAIPITRWNYVWEDDNSVPHIGPTAQDFKAAFYPGRNVEGISTFEADGVHFAAIQALAKLVKELAGENQELRKRVSELESVVHKAATR